MYFRFSIMGMNCAVGTPNTKDNPRKPTQRLGLEFGSIPERIPMSFGSLGNMTGWAGPRAQSYQQAFYTLPIRPPYPLPPTRGRVSVRGAIMRQRNPQQGGSITVGELGNPFR